ncbi:NUDIX hydrolase [Fictibacillus iocasae]|uniref:NUDIX hydrolase n=1 Tax=Fictibacillus iocasae TaxID=2715437 RepID=A0ABW2NQC0_9BACL
MNFSTIFEEDQLFTSYSTLRERIAVRGIILINGRILLVQSNRGDYKFPGGGVEEAESHEEALIREIREETGYKHAMVISKAGIVIERGHDENNEGALFQMTSHYYFCDLVNEEKTFQQLEDYEVELEFTPKWITLEEAIQQNERLIAQFQENSWLRRETFVLNEIKRASIGAHRYVPRHL